MSKSYKHGITQASLLFSHTKKNRFSKCIVGNITKLVLDGFSGLMNSECTFSVLQVVSDQDVFTVLN